MKRPSYVLSILSALLISSHVFAGDKSEFNIIDYGARRDTNILSTNAIQKAIDACSKAGGGKVVVPAGDYKVSSLKLRSGVFIYLCPGATLYGSRDIRDYTPVKPDFVSLRTHEPVNQIIYGENIHNAGICGEGTIDGRGDSFQRLASEPDESAPRPTIIRMVCCSDITVKDVTLRSSGFWMQHYLACDRLTLSNLRIYNHVTKNNDALDLDGCHNAVVTGLMCDTDDDGITLKSTCSRTTENVVISDCLVSSHCNAIKMGTESNGGFRNICMSNCVIRPSEAPGHIFGYPSGISGISLEIVDGGIMEGISISNMIIRGTESPLYIRLGNRARPYSPDVPVENVGVLRDIMISDVTVMDAGRTGCSITGIPGHYVENITLDNVRMEMAGLTDEDGYVREPDECEASYPEATGFGILPACGFFVRHARNVEFRSVSIETKVPDVRPPFVFTDVTR